MSTHDGDPATPDAEPAREAPASAPSDTAATRGASTSPPSSTADARHRPTVWIVLCGVLAVAAAGLGIWAFSAQSDADDAQAALTAQAARGATKDASPTPTPAPAATPAATPAPAPQPAPVDPQTQEEFDQVKEDLGATSDSVAEIEQDLDQAASKVDEAEQAKSDATSALDSAKAAAEAAAARFELTRTCLRATLDAVSTAFGTGGLEAAVQELQKLAGNCASAASS